MENAELSGSNPWELITSWFTPKILFITLNIMIGTIFVSSNLKSRTKHDEIHDHDQHYYNQYPNHLRRPPSLLQRVRSFDFSLFPTSQDQPQVSESFPSLLQRVKSIKLSRLCSNTSPADTHLTEQKQTVVADDHLEVIPNKLNHAGSKSEKILSKLDHGGSTSEKILSKLDHAGSTSEKMKKSENMKEIDHEEGEQIRPATTREGKEIVCGVDEEVDAKADDFINRFRQQLKLQRLESLLRYRELLKRGSFNKRE